MKKLFAIIAIVIIASCSKEGEIKNQSTRTIKINGNEYRFIKVVPADGEKAVWLLVPANSNIEIPQPISYRTSCGKNCTYMLTSIWVKA